MHELHRKKLILIIGIVVLIGIVIMLEPKADFKLAINKILKNEGGYVFDPVDPGGETQFGISKRSYPNIDIKNLTRNQAIDIYFEDYWLKNNLQRLSNQELADKILDMVVNVGSKQAFLIVSRAIRACGIPFNETEIITPQLIFTINTYANKHALLSAIRSEFAGYYRLLVRIKPKMSKYINGWLKRAYDE